MATPKPKKTSFQKAVEAERARQEKLTAGRKPAKKAAAKKTAPLTYYQGKADAPTGRIPASNVPGQTDRGRQEWSRDYANWNGSGRHGPAPRPGDREYNF